MLEGKKRDGKRENQVQESCRCAKNQIVVFQEEIRVLEIPEHRKIAQDTKHKYGLSGNALPAGFRSHVANVVQSQALISYTATGSQLGLSLLAHRRADVCGIHWGPAEESLQRHPALIRQFVQSADWALVRLFRREQGLLVSPGMWSAPIRIEDFFHPQVRWVERQEGAGSQRFLRDVIAQHDLDPAKRRITGHASTEREAAALLAMGQAEVAPGARAAATEFGLDFVSIGWEAFDFALYRGIFFRNLFQQLLDYLRGSDCRRQARMLGGYDLAELGTLVWTGND